MLKLDLTNKRALVCGSTQGIGQATAHQFAECGATVVLMARNADKLKAGVANLPTPAGQQHDFLAADFSQPENVSATIAQYVDHHDPLQILVNNTGGPPGGQMMDADPVAFLAAFQQHLICNQILAQALVSGMKSAGYGRIINIISTSVKQPIPGLGVSNTTRGAVANWAKTLSMELAGHGITVNNVLPGATSTGRLAAVIKSQADQKGAQVADIEKAWMESIPAGRFAGPEEVAAAVTFLASPLASYVNGINLPVDGGRTRSL